MRAVRHLVARWRGDETGIAAIEFAAIAPVLVMMVVASMDLSGALAERLAIGHAMRSGAQVALADPGPTAVLGAMRGAAPTFSIGTTAGPATLALSVARVCACPDTPATYVACTTVCSGSRPTYISYRLTGEKVYGAILVPDMAFSDVLEVQIR
jgi:Flp pilus assembly protein TadG